MHLETIRRQRVNEKTPRSRRNTLKTSKNKSIHSFELTTRERDPVERTHSIVSILPPLPGDILYIHHAMVMRCPRFLGGRARETDNEREKGGGERAIYRPSCSRGVFLSDAAGHTQEGDAGGPCSVGLSARCVLLLLLLLRGPGLGLTPRRARWVCEQFERADFYQFREEKENCWIYC